MKKFLVIGNPIEHSLSPELHNYWIKNSSIDAIYEKEKINEDQLEQIISQVKDNKIKGINVISAKGAMNKRESYKYLQSFTSKTQFDPLLVNGTISKIEDILLLDYHTFFYSIIYIYNHFF